MMRLIKNFVMSVNYSKMDAYEIDSMENIYTFKTIYFYYNPREFDA